MPRPVVADRGRAGHAHHEVGGGAVIYPCAHAEEGREPVGGHRAGGVSDGGRPAHAGERMPQRVAREVSGQAVRPPCTAPASSSAPTCRIGSFIEAYGLPPTNAVPASGASMPRITRIVVDLPAPFGPRKPVTRPGFKDDMPFGRCRPGRSPARSSPGPWPRLPAARQPTTDDRRGSPSATSLGNLAKPSPTCSTTPPSRSLGPGLHTADRRRKPEAVKRRTLGIT